MPISVGYVRPNVGDIGLVTERFHYGSQAESLKLVFRMLRVLGVNHTFRFVETHEEMGSEGAATIAALSADKSELLLILKGPVGYDGACESQDFGDYALYCVYKLDLRARMEPNFDIIMDIALSHRLRMSPIMIEGKMTFTEDDDPEGFPEEGY